MRRWTINGRFLTQTATGVQRTALEVVRALDACLGRSAGSAAGLDIDIVAPPDADPPALEAIRFRRVGPLKGHAWEQTVLPAQAPGGLISLCNTGPLRHSRQIVCIHDANTRTFPASYTPAFRAVYRVLLPALGRRAAAVTTVSRHSAAEIARFGICRRDRVTVIHNGHEHARRWVPVHSAATRAAAGPQTVVVLASAARHKNVGLILGLASQLRAAGLKVAVAGGVDQQVFGAVAANHTEGVTWLGRISDGQLAALLRDSLCLAFPSLTEGFGMPALEAMALGCPAVVSDRASLPEVCGDAGLYACPENPAAWLRCIKRLDRSAQLRRELVRRGHVRAARFSWATAAESYLQLMAVADGLSTEEAA